MKAAKKPRLTKEQREAMKFVRMVAGFDKDGEPKDYDGDGDFFVDFEMSIDDAYETLHSLINKAREITGTVKCEHCRGAGQISDPEYMDGDPYMCDDCDGSGRKR